MHVYLSFCLVCQNQICGPWVSNDHEQSTHTEATYGNVDETFRAEVWINKEKQNHMIAHIRIGEVQLAVEQVVNVNPAKCEYKSQYCLNLSLSLSLSF